MRRAYRKKIFPIRSLELPMIKRSRIRELRNNIGSSDDLMCHRFELGFAEFMMVVCMYECNMTDMVYYIDLVNDYGAILVHAMYVLLTVVLSMPLYMLLVFMSSYSKKSYLKFFAFSPLFDGLGYVIAVVKITGELFNTTLAGIALLIIYHCIVGEFKSTFCKGLVLVENGTIETCLTMHPKVPYNHTCEDQNVEVLLTATQYYIKKKVTTFKTMDVISLPEMNKPLLVSATVIWAIILFTTINGIRRMKKIAIGLQIVCGCIMAIIVLITLFHGHSRPPSQENAFGSVPLLSFDFWVDMVLHTTYSNGFGSWIWLGTIKPKKLDPKFAIMLSSLVKLVIYAMVTSMSAMVVQDNLSHLKIMDPQCFAVSGFHILFSFVPDVLYRTGVEKLAIPLWYAVLCYFSFLSPMYSIMGLVDSFVQRFRVLSSYKLYVCGIVCICCYSMNIILMTDLGGYIMNCWRACGMPILTATLLMMINISIFFVYSGSEVIDDYLFTYGTPPEKYWTTFWKTLPIFSVFAFISVAYNQNNREECQGGDYIIVTAYIQCSSLVIPILVVFLMKCIKHVKYADSPSLTLPDSDWGPHNPKMKEKRKFFRPHREIKYRTTTLTCKHRCSATFDELYKRKAHSEEQKFYQLENEFLCYKVQPTEHTTIESIDSIDLL